MARSRTPFSFQHLALWLCSVVILVVLGCGGGGSSASSALTGKSAIRSIAVSGYQSQVAASKYILPMLVASAPAGSQLSGLGGSTGFLKNKPKAFIGLQYDATMGLYYGSATSGPTMTISYFLDSAGTKSAGTLSATIENATTFNTSFTSYPQTVDFVGNVTAGNIPATGNVKIVFTDATGTNTLSGTITAPTKGIAATLNMSLSPTGSVGGSMTVVQNGLTTQVTGLTGDFNSGFTGAAVSNPGNFTGTATINLLNETFTLSLGSGTLTSNTSVDGSGNLTTTYNDGTTLNLSNTVTQDPNGPPTNSTGSTSGSTATTSGTTSTTAGSTATTSGTTSTTSGSSGSLAYGLPNQIINSSYSEILGVNQNKQLVGTNLRTPGGISSNAINQPEYWGSPTSSPITLALASGETGGYAYSINMSGAIVGCGTTSSGFNEPLYWSSSSSTPIKLPVTSDLSSAVATSINASGAIVGYGFVIPGNATVPLYWASSQATPIRLAVTGNDLALQINDNGQVLMSDMDFGLRQLTVQQNGYAEFLQNITTNPPNVLKGLDGGTLLDTDLTQNIFHPVYGINSSGTVTGWTSTTGNGNPVLWTANTVSPTVLQTINNVGAYAMASNDAGATIGTEFLPSTTGSGDKLVIWLPGAAPITMDSVITSQNTATFDGFVYRGVRTMFLFNDYSIITLNYANQDLTQQPYIYIPATKHP